MAMVRKLHRISAGLIVTFAFFHLLNQFCAWFGIAAHTAYLTAFRKIYRIPLVEYLLLLAFSMQIVSGIGMSDLLHPVVLPPDYRHALHQLGIS
jgi:succinate dehydrogenase/fumarate reductase cytochrome b subunit